MTPLVVAFLAVAAAALLLPRRARRTTLPRAGRSGDVRPVPAGSPDGSEAPLPGTAAASHSDSTAPPSPVARSASGVPRSESASPRGTVGDRPVRRRAWGHPLAVGVVGLGCLAVLGVVHGAVAAAALCPAAWVALRRAAARPDLAPPGRSVALALDLCAAALRAGRTPADALRSAAPAAGGAVEEALLDVAGLLRLGASPAEAWRSVPASGPLGAVRTVAVRSATSGIRSAAAFERLADEIRDDAAARSTARAHRAGVTAMGPLAACFLPSFVCLGIVPVVVGVAGSVLGVLP